MTKTDELAARVAALEQQVAVGAWLHNELVHELRVLIATQLGPAARQRSPEVIARAKRIAAARAAKPPTKEVTT